MRFRTRPRVWSSRSARLAVAVRDQPPRGARQHPHPHDAPPWRKFFAFAGPGFLVAVGYMDPGNWATDLAGGAQFGYSLLWVIMMSNLMAILLQHLCIKLGVVTGRDLAQACRDHYPRPMAWFLWVLAELAIAATDLAEVVGSAIGLQLLFGIPLIWGCLITSIDVLVVLYLQNRGFRYLEAIVLTLVVTVGLCFVAELLFSKPELGGVLGGFMPSSGVLKDQAQLYVAIGIIGATVMPHNLYLHSSIVQTRNYRRDEPALVEAVRYATIDSTIALMCALFINAAILIVAAATFHERGMGEVPRSRRPTGCCRRCSGSASPARCSRSPCSPRARTRPDGHAVGQIVMEGFINFRMRPWLRRLITRLNCDRPGGDRDRHLRRVADHRPAGRQPGRARHAARFAVWPLLRFTGSKAKMGSRFVNPPIIKALGYATALIIIGLNVKLLFDTFIPES